MITPGGAVSLARLLLLIFTCPKRGRRPGRIVAAQFIGKMGFMLFVLLAAVIAPDVCNAQGAGAPQAAASTGSSGVSASTATAPGATPAAPAAQNPSHVAIQPGPPLDSVNRKALEARAGKDAANLLLRSAPSGSQVFIDGTFVGKSPLLLILAAGEYKIEMRGPREESGEETVELSAKETREIALALTQRYPSVISFGK
jgi:hypothetical protein